jgi:hypothetical protein
MSAVKTVSGADIDALFNGTLAPPRPAKRLALPTKPVQARYDRCAGCTAMQPLLLSFSGDTDWSPEIPLDDPVRAYVKDLRRVTAKRTIVLCTDCVAENRQYRSSTRPSVETARLFEL